MREHMFSCGGKVALVTGAAQGIGLAIADKLFNLGASVVLSDLNTEKVNRAAKKLEPSGERVKAINGDVSSTEDSVHMVEFVLREFGKIDYLVNNAGIGTPSFPVEKMEDKLWEKMIAVHLTGTFKMTRAAVPIMKTLGRGSIVNMSSNAGQVGDDEYCHYSAAKAGILGLTKALAKELAEFGIRVNAVAPGIIKTDILAVQPAELIAYKETQIPLGRLGTPQDVASTVCFLLSDQADYITGQVLCPNGGRTIVGI